MKTILQILPSLDTSGGGVERGTLDVAKEIAEKGFESMILSAGVPGNNNQMFDE